jgi:hypothetical protein
MLIDRFLFFKIESLEGFDLFHNGNFKSMAPSRVTKRLVKGID